MPGQEQVVHRRLSEMNEHRSSLGEVGMVKDFSQGKPQKATPKKRWGHEENAQLPWKELERELQPLAGSGFTLPRDSTLRTSPQ